MGEPVTVEKFAVGQSVRRIEDARLLRGLGRYSEDVDLPRQAYAVLVRSPHAHARIVGIDARAALKSPGVLAVLTGADLAADGVGNLPTDRTRKRRDGAPASASSTGARSATRGTGAPGGRRAGARCSPPRWAWSRTACAWSASTSAALWGCAAGSIPRGRWCWGGASASAAG